jgi:hypothetical protein
MPTTIEIEAARKAVKDHFGAVAMDPSLESAIDAAITAAERVRGGVAAEADEQLEVLLTCRAWLWSIVQALDINTMATVLEMHQDVTRKPKRTTAVSLFDTLAHLDAIVDCPGREANLDPKFADRREVTEDTEATAGRFAELN